MSTGKQPKSEGRNMRVLAVTNMYPTPHAPTSGIFVEQQINGLRQVGLDFDVLFIDRAHRGMGAYLGAQRKICARVAHFEPDLVHVMYGGVMADQVVRSVSDRPRVVTFH